MGKIIYIYLFFFSILYLSDSTVITKVSLPCHTSKTQTRLTISPQYTDNRCASTNVFFNSADHFEMQVSPFRQQKHIGRGSQNIKNIKPIALRLNTPFLSSCKTGQIALYGADCPAGGYYLHNRQLIL